MLRHFILAATAILYGVAVCAQNSTEEWTLSATEFSSSRYYGVTAANGTMGLISSPEPFTIGETVLAGVYDKFGRGRVNNFLPNI